MIMKGFVLCIRTHGYEASLELRKVYPVIPDSDAARHQQIRVVDESGADYLYPQQFFAPIKLSPKVKKVLLAA